MRGRRSLSVFAVVIGTLVAGLVPASAGTEIAFFDVRRVAFTDSGRLLVRGTLECGEGSVLVGSFPSTFMHVSQVLEGPTFLYSGQRHFDDQVICDGTAHTWRLLFPGHDPISGHPFEQDVPLEVTANLSIFPAPETPSYVIEDIEEFVVADASSREPLRVDVADVRYTASGAVVVVATVRCPAGFVPALDPKTAAPATSMVLEQWYRRTVGDTTTEFARFSKRKSFEDQIVCDGTADVVSLRFNYAKGTTKRFRPGRHLEVATQVNIARNDTNIRAFHEEVFLGV